MLLGLPIAGKAQQTSIFATGLTGPVKLTLTPRGNLLVTERGTAANDGELSIVDGHGVVRPILTGLPSGIETTGTPSGPQSPALSDCCVLHLSIGEGDMLRFSPNGPPAQVPNATGSASPLFSSVLRLVFSRSIDQVTPPFSLTRADHVRLPDGRTVLLTGVPFTPGSASVRLVDLVARTQVPFITGLTSVTDVLKVGKQVYVLEISSSLSSGAPGRLLRFTDPALPAELVVTGLIGRAAWCTTRPGTRSSSPRSSPVESSASTADWLAGRLHGAPPFAWISPPRKCR